MKVTISLELSPAETSVATELLATLRAITEHIGAPPPTVHVTPSPGGPPNGAVPGFQSAPQSVAPPPVPPAPPAPLQQQVSQPAAAPPIGREAMRDLIASLTADPASVNRVAAQLMAIVVSYPDQAAGIGELLEAFEAAVFNPALLNNPVPLAIANMLLLFDKRNPTEVFPQELAPVIRRNMVQKVIAFLSKQRAVTVDRAEFILHAEAFAWLVMLDCVKLEGALQTMEKLVAKPPTRAAAITMLGKTLDINASMLHKAPLALYQRLWGVVQASAQEPNFTYDLQFIGGMIESLAQQQPQQAEAPAAALSVSAPASSAAPPPSSTPTPGPPPPTHVPAQRADEPMLPFSERSLVCTRLLEGHTDCVYSVALNASCTQAASVSKDGSLRAWDMASGTSVARVDLPHNFYSSNVEIHGASGIGLVACGPFDMDHGACGCITVHNPAMGWQQTARLERPGCGTVSCVKCLAPELSASFVVAEQSSSGKAVLSLFDMATVGSAAGPIQTYTGDCDMWSCVATTSAHPHLILSGGADGSILAWDMRMRDVPCGVFYSRPDPESGTYRAHLGTVMAMDAHGDHCVSAGQDGCVSVWDLRQLSSGASGAPSVAQPLGLFLVGGADEESMLLKVAYANSPSPSLAAYGTRQGLFTLDWGGSVESPVCRPADVSAVPAVAAFPAASWHELKWAPGQGQAGGVGLMAAAAQLPSISIFTF